MAYKKVDGMTIDDRRRSASNSRLYNRLHSLHSGRSASTNSSPFNSKVYGEYGSLLSITDYIQAFQHTFSYDDSITGYLSKELREDAQYLALKYGNYSHFNLPLFLSFLLLFNLKSVSDFSPLLFSIILLHSTIYLLRLSSLSLFHPSTFQSSPSLLP